MLAVQHPVYIPFNPRPPTLTGGTTLLRPATTQRPDVSPLREPLREATLLQHMDVLVIEKESQTQDFLRDSLRSLGAEVHVVSDSTGASDLIKRAEKRHGMVFADGKLLKSFMSERDSKTTAIITNIPVVVMCGEGDAKESVSKAGTFFLVKRSQLHRSALVSTVRQIMSTKAAQPVPSTSSAEKTVSETDSEGNREPGAQQSDVQSPRTPPRCVTPPRPSNFNHSPTKSAFTRYSPQQQQARLATVSAPEASCVPFFAPHYPCGPMPMHGQHMHPMPQPTFLRHTSHTSVDSMESISGSEDPESTRMANASRRAEALQRFREKRKRLTFEKKVRYASRKRLAENRPRLRGQFVRQTGAGGGDSPTLSADEE